MAPSELDALAFNSERTGARLLARRTGIAQSTALLRILEQRAGPAGLASMLDGRREQQLADARRRQDKTAANAARLALKKSGPVLAPGSWLAWFDGSALPNPGRIGIGAVLVAPDGRRTEISRRAGDGDSGAAEYLALIAVLEAALAAGASLLTIHGDSRVVIDDVQAAGNGAAALAHHRARARELIALLEVGMGGARVALRWIPRHKNADADRLSEQARGKLTSNALP
jgi:ribonuclease HI